MLIHLLLGRHITSGAHSGYEVIRSSRLTLPPPSVAGASEEASYYAPTPRRVAEIESRANRKG